MIHSWMNKAFIFFLIGTPALATADGTCGSNPLRITVQNLASETRTGYVGNGSAAGFALHPKESRDVVLPVRHPGAEQRIVAYLPDGGQCAGYISLPSGCAPDQAAGAIYLYEGNNGSKCFVRSVAQAPRADATVVLRR